MAVSGQNLEKKVKKILDENIGKKITFNNKKLMKKKWKKLEKCKKIC